MIFEIYRKSTKCVSFIDGNINMFPYGVLKDNNFKSWRKSVALKQDKLETRDYVVTPKIR